MTKKLPKSGNITIKLGVKEVRDILLQPTRAGRYGEKVSAKIYEAVASKFSNVGAELTDEKWTIRIVYGLRDSREWKAVSAQFREEHSKLNELYDALSRREATTFQELAQAKLDEAGIKSYRARGFGFIRVPETS